MTGDINSWPGSLWANFLPTHSQVGTQLDAIFEARLSQTSDSEKSLT